jgi:predicted transcriptional regulator
MITENNEPVGTLNRDQIIAAFRKWEDTTVGSAMKRNLIYLDVETYWKTSLNSANKSNLMLVTENGQHIGVLDTENLLEFLLIKSNLCLKFEKTHLTESIGV